MPPEPIRFALALSAALGLSACDQVAFWDTRAASGAGCRLVRQAEARLDDARNFMLAPVQLDGHPATLVVDTGAEATTLTPQAAEAFGLARDGVRASVLRGVAGSVRSHNVRLRQLAFGGQIIATERSVGVGEMPAFPGVEPPVAGLLGTDVLAGYDVELDLPARRMTLFNAEGCGDVVPWHGSVAVPFQRTTSGLGFVEAVIDGRRVRAMIDTGARTTLVTRQTAAALGITEATLARDASHSGVGIGLGSIAFHQHRFAELGLPGALVSDMPVNIADLRLPGVEMLLGADYLGPRRPWISYSSNRLFLRLPGGQAVAGAQRGNP